MSPAAAASDDGTESAAPDLSSDVASGGSRSSSGTLGPALGSRDCAPIGDILDLSCLSGRLPRSVDPRSAAPLVPATERFAFGQHKRPHGDAYRSL